MFTRRTVAGKSKGSAFARPETMFSIRAETNPIAKLTLPKAEAQQMRFAMAASILNDVQQQHETT